MIAKVNHYAKRKIRETFETKKNLNNIKKDNGYKFSATSKAVIYSSREK
jgi:hypothetical protein